jgi:hypothetical protein
MNAMRKRVGFLRAEKALEPGKGGVMSPEQQARAGSLAVDARGPKGRWADAAATRARNRKDRDDRLVSARQLSRSAEDRSGRATDAASHASAADAHRQAAEAHRAIAGDKGERPEIRNQSAQRAAQHERARDEHGRFAAS